MFSTRYYIKSLFVYNFFTNTMITANYKLYILKLYCRERVERMIAYVAE